MKTGLLSIVNFDWLVISALSNIIMGNCTDGNPTIIIILFTSTTSLCPHSSHRCPTHVCLQMLLLGHFHLNFNYEFFFFFKEFFKINCDKIFIKIYFSQLLFFLTSFYFLPLIHKRSLQRMNPYTTDLYTRCTNATLSGVCTSLLICHVLEERVSHYCSSSAPKTEDERPQWSLTTARHENRALMS